MYMYLELALDLYDKKLNSYKGLMSSVLGLHWKSLTLRKLHPLGGLGWDLQVVANTGVTRTYNTNTGARITGEAQRQRQMEEVPGRFLVTLDPDTPRGQIRRKLELFSALGWVCYLLAKSINKCPTGAIEPGR